MKIIPAEELLLHTILGKGYFSIVLLAHWGPQRLVAVKVLRIEEGKHDKMFQSLREEAHIMWYGSRGEQFSVRIVWLTARSEAVRCGAAALMWAMGICAVAPPT